MILTGGNQSNSDDNHLRPDVSASTGPSVPLRRPDPNKIANIDPMIRNSNIQLSNNMNNVINNSTNNGNSSNHGGGGSKKPGNRSNPSHPQLSSATTTNGSPLLVPNRSNQHYEEIATLTGYYACSRYFLFMTYMLLLISLILNTFLHFIVYGSNMSIGSMLLDVHHRQELINGEYHSLEAMLAERYWQQSSSTSSLSRNNPNMFASNQFVHHNSDGLHCDRNQFLSILDEFYHSGGPVPKPTLNNVYNGVERNSPPPPSSSQTSKSYPKLFANFNNYRNSKDRNSNNPQEEDEINAEDDVYYSSSSVSNPDRGPESSGRIHESTMANQRQRNNHDYTNENRLLIIEIASLILLFVTILNQVLGLIAVIRKHLVLLVFVTVVDSLLFCIVVFISNFGLIILLLIATCGGYLFIFQLKIGLQKRIKERVKLKEDIACEVQEAIVQMRNRMSPCIHVSMEQYEAMTQQMLNRYSSPIVYCPHYNESLC